MDVIGAWSGGSVAVSDTKIEPSLAKSLQFIYQDTTSYGSIIQPSGLKDWYKFEESGSVCTDTGVSGITAILMSGTLTMGSSTTEGRSAGKFASGIYPNQIYWANASGATLGTSGTISLWFNPDSYSQSYIWSKITTGNEWDTYISATNGSKIVTFINNSFMIGSVTPTLGSWHHVAVSWVKNGSMLQYLDGALDVGSATGSKAEPNINLAIGAYNYGNPSSKFDGYIDDFKVWDRALTATEIASEFLIVTGSYYPSWASGGVIAAEIQNTSLSEDWSQLKTNWDFIGWVKTDINGSLYITVASDSAFTNYNKYLITGLGSVWNLNSIDLNSPIESGGTIDWTNITSIKLTGTGSVNYTVQDFSLGAVANHG
jgi:hypothetical protein